MIRWLRIQASTAGGVGLIPSGETKIAQAAQCYKKKKKTNAVVKIQVATSRKHYYVIAKYFSILTQSTVK